jgi:hypothetical protein
MPEGVRRYPAGEFGESYRCSKPLLDRSHRLAVELDETVRDQLSLFPALQLHEQSWRDRRREIRDEIMERQLTAQAGHFRLVRLR